MSLFSCAHLPRVAFIIPLLWLMSNNVQASFFSVPFREIDPWMFLWTVDSFISYRLSCLHILIEKRTVSRFGSIAVEFLWYSCCSSAGLFFNICSSLFYFVASSCINTWTLMTSVYNIYWCLLYSEESGFDILFLNYSFTLFSNNASNILTSILELSKGFITMLTF